jgi:GAG-pre-integrase domain
MFPIHSSDANWVIDSGANNHVTNDINNISSFFAHNGPDKLQIDNDFGLAIANIGSFSFILSSVLIHLTNVLHVPNFSTNLLSLAQLLYDNPSLSINFISSFYTIKDFHIKSPLQIPSSNGLYYRKMKSCTSSSSPHSPQDFYETRTTTSMWHARLGHPSRTITIRVINSNRLSCIRDSLTFCHDCI